MTKNCGRERTPQGTQHEPLDTQNEQQVEAGLVSVVIPCYNQAHFLGEAIESVLAQNYRCFEIIVVDDGSTDDTSEVAAYYPGVRCICQDNKGLAAARNTGARESKGDYLVFLDADDRLLPNALKVGSEHLNAHPECGFVSGHYREIAVDGSPLPTEKQPCPDTEHYLEMLRANYIGMPAVVMYRRSVFELAGGFDNSARFKGCEDYELHMRLARDFPVYCHGELVAEYRQHGSSMSSNAMYMLKAFLAALDAQREHVKGDQQYKEAIELGARAARNHYGGQLAYKAMEHAREGEWKQAMWTMWNLLVLLRHHPQVFVRAWQKLIQRRHLRR